MLLLKWNHFQRNREHFWNIFLWHYVHSIHCNIEKPWIETLNKLFSIPLQSLSLTLRKIWFILARNSSHIDGHNSKTLICANGISDESRHPFQNYLSLLKDLLLIISLIIWHCINVAILELENQRTFHQKEKIKLF